MKPRLTVVALLALGLASPAAAQHVLAVREGGATAIVVGAREMSPIVERNGKRELERAERFAFGPGGEYLPFYVSIGHVEVKRSALGMKGVRINREFHLYCVLETAYHVDDVYMVVTTENEIGERGIFLFEVGTLEPRDAKPFHVVVPTDQRAIPGHYHLYLFSAGKELLDSLMPKGAVAAAYARMIRERIKGVADAPARPFVGPQPEYPRALKRAKIDGSATLAFTVDEQGVVSDASVARASRPEFGGAALAAIGEWHFLPRVTGGVPVKSRVELPFAFDSSAK